MAGFFKFFFRTLLGLGILAGLLSVLLYLTSRRPEYIKIYSDDEEEMF